MLRFLACFSCQQKSGGSKTQIPQPISAQNKQDSKLKKYAEIEAKGAKVNRLKSQLSIGSTCATNSKTLDVSDEEEVFCLIERLKSMEMDQRRTLEYKFVKSNCFARGPKYVVEKEWSLQYTEFLNKKKHTLRKVNNDKILSEQNRIYTGFQYSKDYFVISKKVWILVKNLYGGGPEVLRDKMLPIKELPPFGLSNPRYSCYLNSGLQTIFSIPEFVDYFYNECFTKIKHKTKHSQKKLSSLTSKFLRDIPKNPDKFYDMGSLRNYIQIKFPEMYQHDCQEFLRYFISRLQEELNPRDIKRENQSEKLSQSQILDEYDLTHNSIVDSLFHGQQSSYIKCGSCENISIVHDPTMEITLQMSSLCLQQCLENYFNVEKLVDYYDCDRCLKGTKATRQFYLEKAPTYLMVTLKRFLQNQKKNSDSIRYPLQLSLNKYFKDPPKQNISYDLQSVIIHKGETDQGHYYLHTKREGKWYELNDESVKRVSIRNHLQSEAYILMYKLE